ncbi:MAG TPA: carboxypeptidase regulatory-like domain-containing protein [Bryobacteraceae bacterium]|nr:carboxypeptidase regulatory-like domain-containing protein [Bryobacteraceae bacterium]
MHGRVWVVHLFCAAAVIAGHEAAFGQAVAGGQIHGVVTDPSGSAVVGAQVTAEQGNSGLHRSTLSGGDGGFVLPNLPVGPYSLQVAAKGFSNYRQAGIVIQVGDNLAVNVSLKVGAVSEAVEVSAGATMVQTEDTSVSEVIDQRRIVDLPLNGRQPTQLILLSGAAANAPAGDLATSKNYPSSVTISVAGGQANGTNYLLDGADNNDAFSNVNLPFPFPDALQEFSVENTGLSARYGLHPGSVVNIVTKSGGNGFHGDLFEFLRNGDVNARNFFAPSHDTLRRNQFGGTVGGPVVRNKLFFFFGYQGTRTRTTPPQTISFVPTASILQGDFSAFTSAGCQANGKARTLMDPATGRPFPNNFVSPSQFNPQALALLKYVPQSNDPCGKITYGIPSPSGEDQYTGRVDWNVSEKHTVFARYFLSDYGNPPYYDGSNLLTVSRPGVDDRSQSLVIGDNYSIGPSLVNELHATGTRLSIHRGPPANTINPQTLGVNISAPIPNFLDVVLSNEFTIGCGVCIPSVFANNSVQLSDDLDWVRGRHHLSFGVDWIHNQLNTYGAFNINGVFTFNGQFTNDPMADFLLGRPSDFNQGNPTGGNFRQNYIGLYAQDDVRVNSRFSFHVGLRWEPYFPFTDIFGRGASFSRSAFDAGTKSQQYLNAPPGLFFLGDPGIPPGYINRRLANFEPRVGFAWNPDGQGKQSIRASYSVGYDTPEIFYESRFETNAPWGSSVDIPSPAGGFSNPYNGYPGGNPFPLPFPPSKSQFFPLEGVYVVQPLDLRPTYMQQWDLSYQRQIGKDWLLSATYLGNKTTHLWAGTELDPAVYLPGACSGQPCSTTKNTNQRRVLYREHPGTGVLYSTIAQTDDGANASFNGLILTARHRFSQNFTILTNYTYSHCLSSANFAGDIAGPSYQNPANRNADWGNCSFDLRHNFNASIVATTPKFAGKWTNRLLGNWQIAPLFVVHSGIPFNPVTGLDNSLTGVGLDRPNVTGSPYLRDLGTLHWLNGSAFAANPAGTFGNVGVNSLYGPGYFDIDAALSRFFQIVEGQRLEVRAEFFNLTNHPNFSNPTNSLQSSNFGKILAAGDPRILQFSLKYSF